MDTLPHTDDSLYLLAGYIRPLLDYARAREQSIEPFADALNVDATSLLHADLRLPNGSIDTLFAVAEELFDDDKIGFHVGTQIQVGHLGVLGYLLTTATRLGEVFALHGRYQSLVSSCVHATFIDEGPMIRFELEKLGGVPPGQRHNSEYDLALMLTMCRWLTGREFVLSEAELPGEAPSDCTEQAALAGCELVYGASGIRVRFPSECARWPILTADPQLRQSLEAVATRRLDELIGSGWQGDPVSKRIRDRLARDLAHGVPELEQVASRFDMTPRQLQRHLERNDMTYTRLVDAVRRDQAERYMADISIPLVDVALLLGYSEQSSFQRAFRRWFSVTPGAYRRQLAS